MGPGTGTGIPARQAEMARDTRDKSAADGWFEEAAHVLPLRVYFEDTDAGGIVYYANYLSFMERGRSDMLRGLGIRHGDLAEEAGGGVYMVVRRCEIDFLKPARLDDVLEIHTSLVACGGASLTLDQTVRRAGEELVRARVKVGCMNAAGQARRWPAAMRRILESWQRDGAKPRAVRSRKAVRA